MEASPRWTISGYGYVTHSAQVRPADGEVRRGAAARGGAGAGAGERAAKLAGAQARGPLEASLGER